MVTLEFILITTIVLFLLLLAWTGLRARIAAKIQEIEAAAKAQKQSLQSAPATVEPRARPKPSTSDLQVVEEPAETYGMRFGPPPSLGVPRLAPPPPPK